ncbi:hypothetical protein AM587_10016595 [Phytophthora nicotianae]|uniref:Uncharacterized protein n=1 Tax=Phytophthora nicotianae TaxID=4792 RepID=A0A0W8CVP3_PHYNI|nr:hypothetical protein AM587_10016595 [Phytophthora nicotianae]
MAAGRRWTAGGGRVVQNGYRCLKPLLQVYADHRDPAVQQPVGCSMRSERAVLLVKVDKALDCARDAIVLRLGRAFQHFAPAGESEARGRDDEEHDKAITTKLYEYMQDKKPATADGHYSRAEYGRRRRSIATGNLPVIIAAAGMTLELETKGFTAITAGYTAVRFGYNRATFQ